MEFIDESVECQQQQYNVMERLTEYIHPSIWFENLQIRVHQMKAHKITIIRMG